MVTTTTFISKAGELRALDGDYPSPERPVSGSTYSFPSNADNLADSELDTWLLFLGSWRGQLVYQILLLALYLQVSMGSNLLPTMAVMQ